MATLKPEEYDVMTDGRRVWVNSAGGCIGRFGLHSYEVHTTAEEQRENKGECLKCYHGVLGERLTMKHYEDWVASMKEHYGVEVNIPLEDLDIPPSSEQMQAAKASLAAKGITPHILKRRG